MKNIPILILIILFSTSVVAQFKQFTSPLEGEYAKDFIIVNYPDWGTNAILDHNCGTKTYAKHAGTDITLKSFPQMDLGVHVLAADSGVVTFIHDGEFDRQTTSVPSRGLGNYIAIRHPNKMYSYYGHLKKNSTLVSVGETVSSGQIIAQVGSSGNSTDPHLHFEVWYDSLYLVDPFSGPCGNDSTLWLDPLPYDTSFNVWEYGTIGFVPHIDSLRERVDPKNVFTVQDSIICFWNLQYGLKKGDSSRIEWFTPQDDLWFEFTNYYQNDWWYYYYYSFITTPPIRLSGEWTYRYYHNDDLKTMGHFTFDKSVSIQDEMNSSEIINYSISNNLITVVIPDEINCNNIQICSQNGTVLMHEYPLKHKTFTIDISAFIKPNLYFLVLNHNFGTKTFKCFIP